MRKTYLLLLPLLLSWQLCAYAQEPEAQNKLDLNKPDRLEWFSNLGFGMFVHFSFDSQLGVVISHSMVGASDEYLDKYVHKLPKTFNPKDFDAQAIAQLAKLAGMKYVVFTAKHHSGFCMWDTETTGFNITNTPFGKDLLQDYVEAVRNSGLAVGLYYSPEDFNFLYEQGLPVRRRFVDPIPPGIMKDYLELVELQCIELMAHYGDIDVIFFDGGEGPLQEKCKEVVWELQPNIIVTRGAIKTPEQKIPGISSSKVWESCMTMGTQWAFKPTNETYKSAARMIEILIETRAKGGNLLLNIGPKPSGAIPEDQESALREIAAWNFINEKSLRQVHPWIISNEENIWYTWDKKDSTLYAFLTRIPDWPRGERKEFKLYSVLATQHTEVEVLGHAGELVEYKPGKDASVYFTPEEDGLVISCVRGQRIYNNHKWHNPIVLKLSRVRPALQPPVVLTIGRETNDREPSNQISLKAQVIKTGDLTVAKAGFEFREYIGFAENLNNDIWMETKSLDVSEGEYSILVDLEPGKTYQYRAFIDHPRMRIYGDIKYVEP